MQVGEERGASGLIEAVGLIGGFPGGLLGLFEGVAAVEQGGVLRQAGLGFTDGVEHHAVKACQRCLRRRFSLMDACPRAVGRDCPVQQRPEAPAVGGRFAEVLDQAGGTDARANADVRIQLAGGHTNFGCRHRQMTFSLTHIRAAFEQCGAIAHRHDLRNMRQRIAAADPGR